MSRWHIWGKSLRDHSSVTCVARIFSGKNISPDTRRICTEQVQEALSSPTLNLNLIQTLMDR